MYLQLHNENYRKIRIWNSLESTYTFELNKYADWIPELDRALGPNLNYLGPDNSITK